MLRRLRQGGRRKYAVALTSRWKQGNPEKKRKRERKDSGADEVEDEANRSTRSEFYRKASRIGLAIHEASQKIARLAKSIEIQQLTVLIKDDVTAINTALQDLQAIQNLEMSDGRHLEDRAVHYTAVCDDLKGRLMGTTKQLQMSSPQELKT
ncbi:hypothetical protein MLD38_038167 [Melastoma candidum]|uniref:Uncharacterized protein n=1 Tax=Melastoma candidum TaxID=119954 RepID=A0ACB9KZI5_9MYRT|nr:hypothetical protein MLD38_038167 [Melastoma candidum]